MSDTSTTSDLVPAAAPTGTSVATVTGDDGFASSVAFKPLELKINRMKGEFWLDGAPAPRQSVELVLRGCHRAQTYYGLPYKPGEPHNPSCQSVDGANGYGWVDTRDQTPAVRKCAGCIRKGFGAGMCTDLMIMLAYDIQAGAPVLTRFQNAELNQKKGVFTLAVNRFRSMGLRPIETKMTLSFTDVPNAQYKALAIDVEKHELEPDLVHMMDVCWAAYEESRLYEVQELLLSADGGQILSE